MSSTFRNIGEALYQDKYVRILHPDDPSGIKVLHNSCSPDILTEGIKTGLQLYKEGKEFGRTIQHPYSFFRTPSYLTPKWKEPFKRELSIPGRYFAVLNVDLYHTYVYHSEARTIYNSKELKQLDHYITLVEYFDICKNIESVRKEIKVDEVIYFDRICIKNFYVRKVTDCSYKKNNHSEYITIELKYNGEILVGKSHIPPEWFVATFKST
jgi:hypothetical protein